MDSKDNNNSDSKIFKERYSRVMGSDWHPHSLGTQSKKKIFFRWFVWFVILLVFAIGITYFIDKELETTKEVITIKSEIPQIKETSSYTESLTVLDYEELIENLYVSEQNDVVDFLSSREIVIEPMSNEELQNTEVQDKSLDSETKVKVMESEKYLVIVKSTRSKVDAIEYANKLGVSGYNSEVILSSTGYYGVVLGRFSYENAKKAITVALDSGVITEKPYFMTQDRVKDYVYSESHKSLDTN